MIIDIIMILFHLFIQKITLIIKGVRICYPCPNTDTLYYNTDTLYTTR